jgi:lipopolysaccharide transport system ATP-binding protein
MSSDDIAIRVSNLSKCYQIYDAPRDRLKQFILPRLLRLGGQPPRQYFREFWALRDVSFEVKKGETLGIIGRNGSGKSTLLQMVCGTLNPTSGSIQTNGRIAALLELGSGFSPDFTGRENVYMNASVLGLKKDEIDARFDEIAAFADIGEFIEQPVKAYSSGMLMRLAFAVIAHVDAEILIVDEALSVGDAVFIQKCNRFLRSFLQRGTLVFVSHSLQSVLDLCDRAIWLVQGDMHMDGEAKEVVRHYSAFVHQQINADSPIRVETRAPASALSGATIRPINQMATSRFRAEVFAFDPDTPHWGAGGAEIIDIEILDGDGQRLDTINGGAPITVRVQGRSTQQLVHPVIGFSLRNQRGVELISENTSNAGDRLPPQIPVGAEFHADFRFFLPYLPIGEYFFGGAVADRPSGEDHLQHHRRDDALRISVLSSHVVYGIFSMPMDECVIEVH